MSAISVTKHDYDHLRNDVLLVREHNAEERNHLPVLKLRYEHEIKSKRRLDDIDSIEQLLEVLEKRDCVSENDITILQEIATQIGNHHFAAEMEVLKANLADTGKRNIYPTPQRLDFSTGNVQYLRGVTNIVPNIDKYDVKMRVIQTISTTMGTKWIDFARALNVVESKIDHLKIIYNNNAELCTKEVLDFHEQNVHPRDWKTKLLNALDKARRNDIKNEVNRIYDAFSEY